MSEKGKPITVTESPSIGGLEVIASAGPGRKPIIPVQDPDSIDWKEVKSRWSFIRRTKRFACGHKGPRNFILRIWGETYTPSKRKQHLCPDCALKELKSVAIRCCLCGLAIVPGEGVAVYDTGSIETKDFEYRTVDDGVIAIGCVRWDCCPSGGFFGGYWNGKDIDSFYS